MSAGARLPPPVRERRFGHVNWLGLWSLIHREVLRFAKLWIQTLIAPIVTAGLFVTVFAFAFSSRHPDVGEVSFLAFLAPGMVMMAVIQNAFQNTSTSILHAKIMGNIFDTLVVPLSPGELNLGYSLGGVARGMVVALGASLVLFPAIGTGVAHPVWAIYFALAASCLMASVGIIAGMWARKFDHMSTVTNFVIVPLSFLSGTFYSIRSLPPVWDEVSRFNPLFYLIDGFRYGVIGVSDADPVLSAVVTSVATVLLWALCWHLFRIGYRLKD